MATTESNFSPMQREEGDKTGKEDMLSGRANRPINEAGTLKHQVRQSYDVCQIFVRPLEDDFKVMKGPHINHWQESL